jgi:hypothetical protein
MPRKAKTPLDVIADGFQAIISKHNQMIAEEFRADLPELFVRALGLPSADDFIANSVANLITQETKRRPGRPKGSKIKGQKAAKAETATTKRGPGRPKGSKNKAKKTPKVKAKAQTKKAKAKKSAATKGRRKAKSPSRKSRATPPNGSASTFAKLKKQFKPSARA